MGLASFLQLAGGRLEELLDGRELRPTAAEERERRQSQKRERTGLGDRDRLNDGAHLNRCIQNECFVEHRYVVIRPDHCVPFLRHGTFHVTVSFLVDRVSVRAQVAVIHRSVNDIGRGIRRIDQRPLTLVFQTRGTTEGQVHHGAKINVESLAVVATLIHVDRLPFHERVNLEPHMAGFIPRHEERVLADDRPLARREVRTRIGAVLAVVAVH